MGILKTYQIQYSLSRILASSLYDACNADSL